MARERYNWLDIMKLIAIWLMYITHYDGMGRFGILGLYSVSYTHLDVYKRQVEFFRLCVASITAVVIFIAFTLVMFQERRVPISVYFLSAMFASSLTLYSRLTYRMYRNTKLAQRARSRRRTLVIGAGDAASTLLHEVFKSNSRDMNVVCCVCLLYTSRCV